MSKARINRCRRKFRILKIITDWLELIGLLVCPLSIRVCSVPLACCTISCENVSVAIRLNRSWKTWTVGYVRKTWTFQLIYRWYILHVSFYSNFSFHKYSHGIHITLVVMLSPIVWCCTKQISFCFEFELSIGVSISVIIVFDSVITLLFAHFVSHSFFCLL